MPALFLSSSPVMILDSSTLSSALTLRQSQSLPVKIVLLLLAGKFLPFQRLQRLLPFPAPPALPVLTGRQITLPAPPAPPAFPAPPAIPVIPLPARLCMIAGRQVITDSPVTSHWRSFLVNNDLVSNAIFQVNCTLIFYSNRTALFLGCAPVREFFVESNRFGDHVKSIRLLDK